MAFDTNKRAQAHWKENCQNMTSQFTVPCNQGVYPHFGCLQQFRHI